VFSNTLRELLRDVPGWNPYYGVKFLGPLISSGIEFVVEDRTNQPPAAIVMEQAFQNAEIPFHIREDKSGAPRSANVPTPKMEFQLVLGPAGP
jgi:hypothetical protein